jgi:hypothetical protein
LRRTRYPRHVVSTDIYASRQAAEPAAAILKSQLRLH